MKRKLQIRIPAVILTVALLFTTVFSMSIFVNAASFTPRTTAPDWSNKYYYSDINVFYKYGYGMPNCTAYAYGRAYEILGSEPKLSWGGAGQWYGYNQSGGYYKYGSTPQVGAIACWSYSGGGHVAVVEKIDSDGTMTLSNSEWAGRSFYLTTAKTTDSNPGGNSWWTFQGYIYLVNSPTVVDEPTTEPKTYNTGVYKTNVSTSLNMRSGAGTSYSSVASIPNAVSLNVTKIQASEGYTWGQTTYNGKSGWVALDFCDYVSEFPAETTAAPAAQPTTAAPATQPTTAAPATESTQAETTKSVGLGVGDVNEDGKINVYDVTEVQKVVADYKGYTTEQKKLCDFNFDGKVTVDDVTGMQHYLAFNY